MFWDSDVAKWIEAASFSLATHPDPQLDALLDEVIALIAQAQHADGYLNTWFTAVEPENRWKNLRDWHELYCAGHLIEAAVAHFQATGKRTLLDVLCRYADHIGAHVRHRAGPAARLLRPPRDRAGAGQAGPRHRRAALPGAEPLLRGRARPQAALLRPGGDRARRRPGQVLGQLATSTTSRTCRCASSTRWSATPCGRSTCTAPWPTWPASMATPACWRPAGACGST